MNSKNELSVELSDFSIGMIVTQLIVFIVIIVVLYYFIKMYRAIYKYVTRFDLDNELQ